MAPRATRQTAVVQLCRSAALYVVEERLSTVLSAFLDGCSTPSATEPWNNSNSYLSSKRVGYFSAISCSICHDTVQGYEVSSVPFHDVSLLFWLDDGTSYSVRVPVPCSWTARMYAASFRATIMDKNLAIYSPDEIFGTEQPTLNAVHWLFSLSADEVHDDLSRDGSYIYVRGGDG
jgi:hypothetical protein